MLTFSRLNVDLQDMEINVALDELLGLRGPISTLIRNLLWLLAFNATYLGIFAFIPKTVGSTVFSGLLNTTVCEKVLKTLPYVYSDDEDRVTVLSMISSLNEESSERHTTFQLPDLSIVTLGYFSIATIMVMMQVGWIFYQKFRWRFLVETKNDNESAVAANGPDTGLGEMQGRVGRGNAEIDEDMDAAAGATVTVALDATIAIVKVGVLLYLKMFLLPLMLGLWLDASTMPLFGHNVSDRIAFAGGDLFSFILLHWVAGITFMLLVTVFLLQLREVAHPDLLARLIRPQEPQPDLLGNLMHETVSTHMKRMFLSLGIYAPLLVMHVFVPIKIFEATGLGDKFHFFHLKFWHVVMPQMQIPFELIIFHLSMLALLERYKNSIGGLQHSWMAFMCRKMGLTGHILPRSVEKFEMIGRKEIFLGVGDSSPVEDNLSLSVDPFWYDLAGKEKDLDNFIESSINKSNDSIKMSIVGESKKNGERVLKTSVNFICLPELKDPSSSNISDIDTLSSGTRKYLLPAKLGRFCIHIAEGDSTTPQIEFWKEVQGDVIPRPPDGWDDLGAGGAFVQGRWAWGKERISVVEGSVAKRTPFQISDSHRFPIDLMMKIIGLFVFSWIAITFAILGLISTPLAVGRSFYYLFRIPENYIHDPFAFCIGASIFFPFICPVHPLTRRFLFAFFGVDSSE